MMVPFRAFGRLPHIRLILIVTLLGGVSETLGLSLFIPLLSLMGGADLPKVANPQLSFWLESFARAGMGFTLAVIALAVIGGLGLIYLRERLIIRSRLTYMQRTRTQVAECLFASRWDYLSAQASGQTVNIIINETYRASNCLMYEVLSIASAIQLICYGAIAAFMSWKLTLLTGGVALLVGLGIRPMLRRSRNLGEQSTAASEKFSFYLVDFLGAARLIKVTGREAATINRLNYIGMSGLDVFIAAEINIAFTYFIVQAMPIILLVLIIILGFFVFEVPVSVLMTFLVVMVRLAPRFAQLQQQVQGCVSNIASYDAVHAVLERSRVQREDTGHGWRPIPQRVNQAVELRHVSFCHDDAATAALADVSLSIPARGFIAIIGGSGAGKSTLIDILAGIRLPTTGEVLIDGIRLSELDLLAWRRRLGYVTQDHCFFNDTIHNNLQPLTGPVEDRRIWDALELVGLADFVGELPDRLETIIGEAGARLSGGQKQRLAFARTLLSDPDLLLLDEATSALDAESEAQVQKCIHTLAERMAVVVVAHRLATIQQADRIYVIEKGSVIETGTYDQLMAKGGRLAELHRLQYKV